MEGGSKSGGEVRRINIVYFLSRKGKVEHPHLIRVYHFHRNGIRLKDVKKWFSELRGKDMPESFAWSYKRRYKAGYVWQDLTDNDLITPISDNEYVLKGSELGSRVGRPLPSEMHSHDYSLNAKQSPPPERSPETLQIGPREDMISRTPPPPRLDEESPPVLSEDSAKRMAVFKLDMSKKRADDKRKKREEKKKQQQDADDHHSSSRRRPTGALRDLLGCASMGTKDSVLLPIKLHEKDETISRDLSVGEFHKLRSFSCSGSNQSQDPNNNSRKSWSEDRSSQKMGSQKPMPAAYRPAAEPNCSQCGKAFRPERLHSHMKSCKALKARRKSSSNQEAATKH